MAEKPAVDAKAWPVPRWLLPAALALFVLVLAIAVARLAPPAPLPAGAPDSQFSAARARTVLEDLAGDSSPRPTGSAAAGRARDRILARLAGMGYRPRVEEGFACSASGNCATVRNVVAELPGSRPDSVLLAAHYDSVAAGPGISDDLTGVAAVLEVARILKAAPRPRNTVIFLLFEGEENGLVGARAFADASPEAGRVRAAVNLEARGTSGPSLMFETSPENRWLMPLLDGSVERPVASSLFQTIYQYLPNRTDFTVLKQRGIAGFNFAFIGNPTHYHSAADTLAHANPGSLQHHGQNALAVVRALAAADLSGPPPAGRAVFFDLLGFELFWWPAARGTMVGLLALVLVALSIFLLFRRRALGAGSLALGLLAWLGTVLVTLALGFGLIFLLRFAGLRTPWPARSFPPQAGIWLLALAVAGFFALRRAGLAGLWAGVWLGWAALGLALTALAPGASYLLLIPAIVAGLCGPALLAGRRGQAVAVILPGLVAAALWFPLLLLMYPGLGVGMLWVIGCLAAVVATTLLPALGSASGAWRWGVTAAAALLALVMLIGIVASPPFSPESPQPLDIVFHQDADTGRARWLVTTPPPLPPALRQAAQFGRPEVPLPWTAPARAFTAEAPAASLPAPVATVVSQATGPQGSQGRSLRLHIASARGAGVVGLAIPQSAQPKSVSLNGRAVPPLDPHFLPPGAGAWRKYEAAGQPGGVDVDLVLGAAGPQEIYVFDRSAGLPPSGAALEKARPPASVAFQEGDNTLVTRKVKI